MGIYIVKSLHSEWIKIGHFKTTPVKPSVYYRYINRGFYSCICPIEIKNKVSFKDLELLYWFPNLDKSIESKLHRQLKLLFQHCGEWYKYENINNILQFIYNDYHGILNMPTIHEYNHAVKWCNELQPIHKKSCLKIQPIIVNSQITPTPFIENLDTTAS
jgi:hypothetical protein